MNNDGHISLDEWYDYTYTHVLSTTPKQVPHKWSYRQQGDLVIAKNPHYELIQREAAEKASRAEAERVRQENERRERETLELEKVIRKRLERENAEKLGQEKAKRDEIEKIKQNKAEHQVARRAKFFNLFSKATLANKIIIVLGIFIVGLFSVSSWGMPKLFALIATITPSATITPTATPSRISMSDRALTVLALPTRTKTNTPTVTPTSTPIPTDSFLLQEDFEDNKANGWYSWNETWTEGQGVNWTIEREPDGNYYASASIPHAPICYGGKSLAWNDYAFESRIMFVVGTSLKIDVHANCGKAHYSVVIQESGNIVFAQYNELIEYKKLGEVTLQPLARNRWYTIRVEITGDMLSMYG